MSDPRNRELWLVFRRAIMMIVGALDDRFGVRGDQ